MIIEKEVKMVINQFNIDYYEKIMCQKLNIGQRIMVPVNILPKTSGVKITTFCEYCGEKITKSYRRYIESRNRGKICCSKCKNKKVLENCIDKYGTRCSLLVPEFHNKMVQNNLKKYGTTHSVTPESIEKMQQTMMIKYNCKGSTGSEEIRSKMNATMFKNGQASGVFTSKQQLYINSLVNGELNYPVGPYHIDIYLLNKNIGIEYSGSGHDLGVKLGRISREKFNALEKARHNYFINHKIPIIEIFSLTDKLPSDNTILKLINTAIKDIELSSSLYYVINLDDYLY